MYLSNTKNNGLYFLKVANGACECQIQGPNNGITTHQKGEEKGQFKKGINNFGKGYKNKVEVTFKVTPPVFCAFDTIKMTI